MLKCPIVLCICLNVTLGYLFLQCSLLGRWEHSNRYWTKIIGVQCFQSTSKWNELKWAWFDWESDWTLNRPNCSKIKWTDSAVCFVLQTAFVFQEASCKSTMLQKVLQKYNVFLLSRWVTACLISSFLGASHDSFTHFLKICLPAPLICLMNPWGSLDCTLITTELQQNWAR